LDLPILIGLGRKIEAFLIAHTLAQLAANSKRTGRAHRILLWELRAAAVRIEAPVLAAPQASALAISPPLSE
jgi:hypothetical protein